MKMLAISEFKAHALRAIDEVAKSKESLIITKRGKPVAEVIPFARKTVKNIPGQLKGSKIFVGDIVSPLGEQDWDVCQ